MTQLTTAECIEQKFIDLMGEHLGGNPLLRQENAVRYAFEKSGIRAQLIAAKEMSKAIKNYEEWRDKFTKGVGYDGLPQDYYPRETNRKALADWQKAGGQ